MLWEVLRHPTYYPDLPACDFHVSGPLKKALKGCTFTSDDNGQEPVVQWFRQQPKEFFADEISRLVQK
jgi:hypothetical protein